MCSRSLYSLDCALPTKNESRLVDDKVVEDEVLAAGGSVGGTDAEVTAATGNIVGNTTGGS